MLTAWFTRNIVTIQNSQITISIVKPHVLTRSWRRQWLCHRGFSSHDTNRGKNRNVKNDQGKNHHGQNNQQVDQSVNNLYEKKRHGNNRQEKKHSGKN